MTREPPAAEASVKATQCRASGRSAAQSLDGRRSGGYPATAAQRGRAFAFNRFPFGNFRLLYSNLPDPISLNCLIPLWFPHSNPRLPYSTLSGVTCHPQPDAKQRGLLLFFAGLFVDIDSESRRVGKVCAASPLGMELETTSEISRGISHKQFS